MSESVQIVGAGLMTPLGQSAWETFRALLKGRTIADRRNDLPADIDRLDLVRAIGSVKAVQHHSVDPSIDLAERAAREALAEANVDPRGLPCFVGTSKGAVHGLSQTITEAERHGWAAAMSRLVEREANAGRSQGSNATFSLEALPIYPCGRLSWHLERRLGCRIRSHTVAACASSLVALDLARRFLISQNAHDTALVVTSEAALLDVFVQSYDRLGVLAPRDDYVARPFDQAARRLGFVLAEQGAAVVIRRGHSSDSPRLLTATAADASDLIRVAPGLPALKHVVHKTWGGDPAIACVHAHAPGTPDHDPQEFDLIADLLGNIDVNRHPHDPSGFRNIYAAKGAIGHGLGASGLSSLVLARLCQRVGKRPPMPWLGEAAPVPLERGAHLVLAAGFAGHAAAASLV